MPVRLKQYARGAAVSTRRFIGARARTEKSGQRLWQFWLFALLRLAGEVFLDVLGGVGVELVAAAAAADVVGLAHVQDRRGAEAAADDALGPPVALGELEALALGADLVHFP